MEKFEADLKSPEIAEKIRKDQIDGSRADVRGTPAIFINGKVLRNRSLAGFKDMIDRELQKINNKK
jgi:protein-disulfide isomerase